MNNLNIFEREKAGIAIRLDDVDYPKIWKKHKSWQKRVCKSFKYRRYNGYFNTIYKTNSMKLQITIGEKLTSDILYGNPSAKDFAYSGKHRSLAWSFGPKQDDAYCHYQL